MSLADLMAADLAAINSTSGDLPTSGTLAAADGSASGSITVTFGDNADALQALAVESQDNRSAPVQFTRADVLAILGRDLINGDSLTVASGANAGVWLVSTAIPDEGGGINASLRLDRLISAGRRAQ